MNSSDITKMAVPKVTTPDCPQALHDPSLERLRSERDPELYKMTIHGPSLTPAGRRMAHKLGLETDIDGLGCGYVVDLFEDLASCWNCAALMPKESADKSYVEKDAGRYSEVDMCGRCNR
jgi:hypothetical protein